MSWWQNFFGWPAIISALGMFAVAFARKRSWLGYVGVALATPFLVYAGHAPNGLWYSATVFAGLVAAALLLRRGRRGWAALCLAPFVVSVFLLALAVMSQWR